MTQGPRGRRIRIDLSRVQRQRRKILRYYDARYNFWTRNGFLPEEADELARFNIAVSRNRTFINGMTRNRRRLIANLRRRGITGSSTEEGSGIYNELWERYLSRPMDEQIIQWYAEYFGIRSAA